jgi:pimeloyl-ACP methyl ester carboxylesterase
VFGSKRDQAGMAKEMEEAQAESSDLATRGWPKGGEPMGKYEEVELHGHKVSFQAAGDGPVLVLLHGITSTADAWRKVMPRLAERYTVIAPDMIGHGRSAKPRGDYSLGAYAAGVRDLLAVLGFEKGTVVGHSFGGGIAMQFSYLFPEYVERMALISSGGLGRAVHPLLRAAVLPGSEWVLPLLAREWSVKAGDAVRSVLGRLGMEASPDIAEFARGYASLKEEGASEAFIHTMRSVIDPDGQRVSALDRLYLADQMPTLIVWGDSDPVIPVMHGRNAHRIVEHSRYVEIEGAGHWPMLDDPDRIVRELTDFMEETEPFEWSLEAVRDRLQRGPGRERQALPAGTG